MAKFEKMKKGLSNQENQKVINAFLLHLKNTNRSTRTIDTYRNILTCFFRGIEELFLHLTSHDIEQWLTEKEKDLKERTIRNHKNVLHSFFNFCVEKGYMEKAPFQKNRVSDNYWEVSMSLSNDENQKVINEFLLSMKNANRSKSTIIGYRKNLQFFFKEREVPFSSLTSEDIKQWLTAHQKHWKKTTIRNFLYFLRAFYYYCVGKGHLEKNPIKYQWEKEDKYWGVNIPLLNSKNQAAVNEFLLSLSVANNSKHTIINYRYFLQTFFKDRKEVYSNIPSDDIQEWLNEHEKGLKEKTIAFHLNALKSFYAFCVEEGYLEKTPIKSRWFPRLPKPIPKYLDKEEVAKVRQQGEKDWLRNRVLIEFLLTSGSRIGEVHQLNRDDVDLEKRIALVFGKGKKFRQVHFSEKCALLLERYLESRIDNDPALFVSNRGKPNRLSTKWMRTILSRIGKKAGLSGSLYPHRFRHTFATDLLGKGAELSFISDELGHRDLKTTQIYANLPKQKIITLYRMYMG
jgi:site-specific recombinase XerD